MKKYFALMLVVFTLALVGTAMATDSDGGHVTIIEIGGSGGTTTTKVYVVTTIVDNVVNVTFFTDTVVVNSDDIRKVAAQQTLNTINSNPESLGLPAGTKIGGNNADITSASDTTQTTTEAQQQAAAQVKKKYGDNFTSLVALGSITISKSQSSAAVFKAAADTGDYYVIELKLPDSAKGLSIYGDTNPSDNPSLPSVSGAAATSDDTTIRFINSSGDLVTTVPDDGVVNMVLYLKEGLVYTPLVYTRTSEIDSSKLETVASVEVVTYGYEEIVAKSNSMFSTAVDGTVIKALNDATGKQYRTLAASEVADQGWTFSTAENTFREQTTGRSFDLVAVNVMPSFTVDSGSYIAAISFDRSGFGSSRTLFDATNFVVYPNTVAEGTEGSARIFTVANGQVSNVTPAQVISGAVTTAYIAFTTNDSAMSASGFNASAAATFRPSVFVKRAVTTSGGDEPTPTPVNPVNPGSSGGGCDAGFGALALAVLGAFMVTRRK